MIGGIVYDLMILGKSIEFSKSSYLIPCVTLLLLLLIVPYLIRYLKNQYLANTRNSDIISLFI
jgi:hypothetical protein